MGISFIDVIISVFGLMLFMVPGFILVKTKLIPSESAKHISTVVLYICTTVFMFLGFQKCTFEPRIGINMLIVAGIALVCHLAIIGIIWLIFRKNDPKTKVISFCSAFSNSGYMGLPFLTIVFRESEFLGEILVYASVFLIIFYILVWTIGVLLVGKKEDVSIKKIVTNPIIIAIVISMILFFTVKIPFREIPIENKDLKQLVDQIMSVLESVGNMVTPLSMLVVGMQIGSCKLKEIFLDKNAYLVCSFKLILAPVVTTLVVAFLPIDESIKYTLFFLLSMPVATIASMLTVQYDCEAKLASNSILLSNLFSIVTIPVIYLLFDLLIKAI